MLCWLAEYDGELYFLTLQTDVSAPVTPPWLGHRVLVEGTAARDRPRICGGVVLEPVVLSVLPELDAACNTAVLPAEDRYNLTFEPPRPPGPSAGRLAFAGSAPTRRADRSRRTTFTLRYDFDGLIVFRHAGELTAIFDAARARRARSIAITGYRGTVLLSNGTTLDGAAVASRAGAPSKSRSCCAAPGSPTSTTKSLARRSPAPPTATTRRYAASRSSSTASAAQDRTSGRYRRRRAR